MSQDLKRHITLQKLVSHETHTVLYAKSIKEWFYFPVNFVKFLRTPFLQNISGRLLLLSLKFKLKLWLQSKRIYTSFPWSVCRLSNLQTSASETTILQQQLRIWNFIVISELQNRVAHYDVTDRVTNSKILLFLIFRISKSMWKFFKKIFQIY